MESSYQILIKKLNNFRRKYYTNLIIRGLLIMLGTIAGLILVISAYEYYSWSGTIIRSILFYITIIITTVTFVFLVIIPALKILKLGKTLSDKEAAVIIGNYFPEIDDKLINTLQLKENSTEENIELILAGIEQKATEIKPISFRKAVTFKSNLRILNYILPLLIIISLILILKPQFISSPAERIINYNEYYSKPLPYSITLLNNVLSCKQHSNFKISIQVSGEEIPEKIWIDDGEYTYRMLAENPGLYTYTYKEIDNNKSFRVITDDYSSPEYSIKVFPVPMILDFSIVLDYPHYISKIDETINNTGDLLIPENTNLKWNIITRDTKIIKFIFEDSIYDLKPEEANHFLFEKRIQNNSIYKIIPVNDFFESTDTLKFNIETVRDEYPVIKINEYKEDFNALRIAYTGEISDDYGFISLFFYFKKDNSDNNWEKKALKTSFDNTVYNFDYQVIVDSFGLAPGESVQYYFEVKDNDIYNGYKKSKSDNFYMRMPEIDKIENKIEENSNDIKKNIKESLNLIEQLERNIENKEMEMFNKKEMDWLDKQQMENMFKQAKELQKKAEELKKLNEEIQELEEMINKTIDPELQQKIKEMQKMFEELFTEEMKKELEELHENLKKDNLKDFLEKMKNQNEDLKENLEQNLELYKQLEYEKLINETIEKLDKLSEEQLKLSEKTKEKEISKESSLKQQNDIKKEFSEIMEDLEKADKLNKELEDPYNMENDTATSNNINEQMDDAMENLEKGKKKKASESQEGSGNSMKKLANSISLDLQGAMMEKTGEDIEQIKRILDNLLDISFTQENLINELSILEQNDPKNNDVREQQKSLKDDFSIVQDSLIAISKRQASVRTFIIKETKNAESHITNSLDYLEEQNQGKTTREQQYALTSINNLSLMLAEALDQMQQSMQMKGGQKGSSKCNNPGQGQSPSMSEIMKQQQGLNKGMKGKMNKSGTDGKEGINGKSEELARMAAQQGEIRRMLQELIDQLESSGGNGDALNKIAEEMKKTEDDLINRRLSQATYERQKNIETRLLKSDKAIQEREKENKRESKEGKNKKNGNQNINLEYKNEKIESEEILITQPIELKPYYRKLYKEYLYKLEKDKKDGNK